jgi:hypothetical protein
MIFIFEGHGLHVDDLGRDITDWDDEDFRFLAKTALDAAARFGCPVNKFVNRHTCSIVFFYNLHRNSALFYHTF